MKKKQKDETKQPTPERDTRTAAEKAHDEQPGAPDPTNAVEKVDETDDERLERDAETASETEQEINDAARRRATEPAPDPEDDERATSTDDAAPSAEFVPSKRVNDPIDLNVVPETRGTDMQAEVGATVDADKRAQAKGETTLRVEMPEVQETPTITGTHISPENQPGGTGKEQPEDRRALRGTQVDDRDVADAPRQQRVPESDYLMDAVHADAGYTYVNGRKVGRLLAGRATTTEVEHMLDDLGVDDADVLAFTSNESGTTLIVNDRENPHQNKRYFAPAPTAAQIAERQTRDAARDGTHAQVHPGDIFTAPRRVNPARAGRFANPDAADSTVGAAAR